MSRDWTVVGRAVLLFLLAGLHILAQPSDTERLQRHFQEGQRSLAAGRYAEAARAFEKLRELNPGIAEVHAALGVSYFQMGEFAQAVPALRQALKLSPKLENTDILLAMSLSELGLYDEALPGLENGFQRSSDPALRRSAGLRLLRAYTGLQRDSKAVEVALTMGRLYPKDPEVLYHVGRVYGNYAYRTMRKLAEVAPESAWRHQAAGEAYESQADYANAIMEYRKVLALGPGRPGIHFRIGRALLLRSKQSNSQTEAVKEFDRELQLDPTNANAAYELGVIYHQWGQFDRAREFFALALKHYPDFEEARLGLSRVLLAMGKPDRALPHLRTAISLNPENEVSYYRLYQVHRALGNVAEQEKALAEFKRLRNEKSLQQETGNEILSRREVTKQELDSEAGP